jgi:hypothetical protein
LIRAPQAWPSGQADQADGVGIPAKGRVMADVDGSREPPAAQRRPRPASAGADATATADW